MAYPTQPPSTTPPMAPMSAPVTRSYASPTRSPPHAGSRRATSMFYTSRPNPKGVVKVYPKKSRLSSQPQRSMSGVTPQMSQLVNERRMFLSPSVRRKPSAFASKSTLQSTLTPRPQPHMLRTSRSPYGSQSCLPTPGFDIQDTSPQILPSPSSIYYPSPLLNQSHSKRSPLQTKPTPRMTVPAPIPSVSTNSDYSYQQFYPERPSSSMRRPLSVSVESSIAESSFDTDSFSSKRSSSLRSASLDSPPYPFEQLMAIPEESAGSSVMSGVPVRGSRSDPTPLPRARLSPAPPPPPPHAPPGPSTPSRLSRPSVADLPSLLISALPNLSMLEVAIRQIKNELLSQNAASVPSTVGLIFVIVTLFYFYTNMSQVGFE